MSQARQSRCFKHISFVLPTLGLLTLAAIQGSPLRAQDAAQGPLVPPPEHHVTRIGNVSEPEAPPSLPEAMRTADNRSRMAQNLLACAATGERDPVELRIAALADLQAAAA